MDSALLDKPAAVSAPAQQAAPWTAVAAIGVGAFALVSSEFLPVGLLPQIARDLGVTPGQAGLMVTMPGIVAALAAPLTVAFAGGFDRRHVMWALLALLALSNLTVALADSFPVVILGRVMMGVAVGGFWTVGGSLGPRLRPGAQGARATSLIFSGVSLGTVAGVPVGTWLGGMAGWRLAFGAATLVSVLVLAMLVRALPPIRPASVQRLGDVAGVLRVPKVQLGLAAIVLIFVAQFGSYTYIAPWLLERGVDGSSISPILFGYGVAGFVGNLLAGWCAARSTRATLGGTAALMGVAVGLMAAGGFGHAVLVALVLAWGLAFGMLPIAVQSWLFSAAPDRLESVSAVFVSSAQAAIGAGALIGGALVDRVGLDSAMWLGAAGALATAALMAAAGRSRVRRA
ncbi:MFS transporter [Massilia sp. KIM]|uniref:MFS transporter n=1 Tax=Massilia sp. KIM TaxID=1955422 RepID=UPI00098EDE9A|nr:MFS transporter [Massilia sp. KIM]OON61216.1 MFS transporter [Massilia sp. KIM]